MGVTVNTYAYMSNIPLDGVIRLVNMAIKAETGVRSVNGMMSDSGSMYQFVFKDPEDENGKNTRMVTMHTNCHGDLPNAEYLAEDDLYVDGVKDTGNTGVVVTIGASGCGQAVSDKIAQFLSPVSDAVITYNEGLPDPNYVPVTKLSLENVLIETNSSLYETAQLLAGLRLGGREEFSEIEAHVKNVSDTMESADVVKRGSFEASIERPTESLSI